MTDFAMSSPDSAELSALLLSRVDANTTSEQPSRFQRRIPLIAKVVIGAVPMYLLYRTGFPAVRRLEAAAAAAVGKLLGLQSALSPAGAQIVIRPDNGNMFLAEVTAACSGVAAACAVLFLGLLIARSGWLKSLRAVAAGIALAVCLNLVRIVLALVAGTKIGPSGFMIAHDWLGTLVTLFSIGVSLLLVMRLTKDRAPAAAGSGASPSAG